MRCLWGIDMKKSQLLKKKIKHIDIKKFDARPLIKEYEQSAFSARTLANAARIYDTMLSDKGCTAILCLSGSLLSAGLRSVVYDLIDKGFVDAIVSTGAIMVDQDFFEALGYRHYLGTPKIDDEVLRKNRVDRVYDTFKDEEQLRKCDEVVKRIADTLEPRPYSSREFLIEMGKFLDEKKKGKGSVVWLAYKKGIPIFVPAFSDCSAGFGLIGHQYERGDEPKVTLDAAKDFLELTKVKMAAKDTGLMMVGGGVPKNFAQDCTVAAGSLGKKARMHKYAVQITVADERDGGLSGSTLKEAHSWGKVDEGRTEMVFAEATLAFPLIASYVYHRPRKKRVAMKYNELLK